MNQSCAPPFVPLSGRVLIEPIEPDRTTDSGLVLVEDRKPETMGRVVAIAEHDGGLAQSIRDVIESAFGPGCTDPEIQDLCANILELLSDTGTQVHVGDTVLFSWVSGQEIMLDDARYLIMPESDLLAVVEES